MEVGMAVVVPVAALPLAYAATQESDHDVLRALLDLPVTLHDPLTEADAPELGRILASAADPATLASDALARGPRLPDTGVESPTAAPRREASAGQSSRPRRSSRPR
jgi:hypothetical protein